MAEPSFCTCCCNGCTERRPKSVKNSFPKKLLVATSVVVIITMCLVPAETRTMHKLRHERSHLSGVTQPSREGRRLQEPRVTEHQRRQHRKQTTTLPAKDDPTRLQRNAQTERFKNATRKIIKKLKNTRRFFNEERRVLNETKEYRDGMPRWVPTISFVAIHFNNYKSQRRIAPTNTERKFMFLMPKLYKSLVEYQDIFKLLINVEVDFPDDPFYSYNKTRHELIGKTLQRLYSTIAEIRENMIAVNIPVPKYSQNKNLNTLEMKVNAPQCLKNDYIAFRAYGNVLNNWYLEFRCPKGKNVISRNSKCAAYEAKLQEKMDTRIPKAKKQGSS